MPKAHKGASSGPGNEEEMIELMKTNDLVVLSYVEALLKDASIGYQIVDHNMSTLYGNAINSLARRVLVDEEEIDRARRLLADANLSAEISTEKSR